MGSGPGRGLRYGGGPSARPGKGGGRGAATKGTGMTPLAERGPIPVVGQLQRESNEDVGLSCRRIMALDLGLLPLTRQVPTWLTNKHNSDINSINRFSGRSRFKKEVRGDLDG